MSATPLATSDPRVELRQQWHEHTDAVFERLFPADAPQSLPDFDQLETRAGQLARDLATWLLEQRLLHHPDAQPSQTPPCPRCGSDARCVPRPAPPLARRVLTTTLGDIELKRQAWRCTTCRVVFFPPR